MDGEADQDDALDLTPDMEVEGEGEAQQEPEDEFALDLGEAADGDVAKHLRAELDKRNARIRDLEANQRPAPEVGKKPDLWTDCDGDPDKFEAALLQWNEAKRGAEQRQAQATQAEQQRSREAEKAHGIYRARAASLGVDNFAEMEDAVKSVLSADVQGAMVRYLKDPARMVVALGRNQAALAKVAAEPDPMRQVLMLHEMEANAMKPKTKPPAPEAATIQRGSASMSTASADKKLAKLQDEARKTGNRTALIAYKRELQRKGK